MGTNNKAFWSEFFGQVSPACVNQATTDLKIERLQKTNYAILLTISAPVTTKGWLKKNLIQNDVG